MSIFLAGPMSGQPFCGHPAFDRVASLFADCEILSPADHDREMMPNIASVSGFAEGDVSALQAAGFDLVAAQRWCFEQIQRADSMLLLPGWRGSKGARLACEVALACGVRVVEYWIA